MVRMPRPATGCGTFSRTSPVIGMTDRVINPDTRLLVLERLVHWLDRDTSGLMLMTIDEG